MQTRVTTCCCKRKTEHNSNLGEHSSVLRPCLCLCWTQQGLASCMGRRNVVLWWRTDAAWLIWVNWKTESTFFFFFFTVATLRATTLAPYLFFSLCSLCRSLAVPRACSARGTSGSKVDGSRWGQGLCSPAADTSERCWLWHTRRHFATAGLDTDKATLRSHALCRANPSPTQGREHPERKPGDKHCEEKSKKQNPNKSNHSRNEWECE